MIGGTKAVYWLASYITTSFHTLLDSGGHPLNILHYFSSCKETSRVLTLRNAVPDREANLTPSVAKKAPLMQHIGNAQGGAGSKLQYYDRGSEESAGRIVCCLRSGSIA